MTDRRPTIATLALALAGISALGFLVLAVGNLAGMEGADEGDESSAVFSTAWFAFTLCGLGALIAGALALASGSRSGNADARRSGLLAVGYVVVALALFVVINAVS